MDRNKKVLIVLMLAVLFTVPAFVFFGPGDDVTKDFNDLGDVDLYHSPYGTTAYLMNEGYTIENVNIIHTMYILYTGSYNNLDMTATLWDSSGQIAKVAQHPEHRLANDVDGLRWAFGDLQALREDRYHFSFDGQYTNDVILVGQSISFFILGGSGIPKDVVFESKPVDATATTGDDVTVTWEYIHLQSTTWKVFVDSILEESGLGDNNEVTNTVSIVVDTSTAEERDIELKVYIDDNVVGQDKITLTIIGEDVMPTTTTTTTTDTTITTDTIITTDTTTTDDDNDEPEPFDFTIPIVASFGAILILVVYLWRRR